MHVIQVIQYAIERGRSRRREEEKESARENMRKNIIKQKILLCLRYDTYLEVTGTYIRQQQSYKKFIELAHILLIYEIKSSIIIENLHLLSSTYFTSVERK